MTDASKSSFSGKATAPSEILELFKGGYLSIAETIEALFSAPQPLAMGAREALEKIAGSREYTREDYANASRYKSEEGIWTIDEYLADRTLAAALASQPRSAEVATGKREASVCVVHEMLKAYDSGNLQMSSPEVGVPENNIPLHPWHEELIWNARQALASQPVATMLIRLTHTNAEGY